VACTPRSAEAIREGEQAGHKNSKLKTLDACQTGTATALLRQTILTVQERKSPK